MFKEIRVALPHHDADVILEFPGGPVVTIQARPSNAAEGYNGSLDIILPENQQVTNWEGDDMQPAKSEWQAHALFAKQLVTTLPGDYSSWGTT